MTKDNPGIVRPTFFGRLRAYLLAGILVTAPIGITLYLTWVIIDFIDGQVMPLLPAQYHPDNYLPFSVPGIGLIVMLVSLTVIGWLTAGILGRWMIRLSEHLMARMPVVRNVYGAIKQIMETVMAQQSNAFREVVLIEYPRRGIWAIGFITGATHGEVQNATEDEMVNVFLPTTPNPTSGFLLFVPAQDIYRLHMTVEEGIKMVISAGIVTPPDRRPKQKQAEVLIKASSENSPISDENP
ncbi:DUF502 domain-containing protein [Nisaea acidiphila]|uniref:DUF502 domain-containing protein n=1 Tax=Nisaea acidiphila TaxID=1862145 RepID=A0A9J7ATF3_9PROT|nr:DUF502 domain-containing protein [Nisaea acidiphila]UUX50130.1 DUF502 domain-containing protein [Nisaea acidiphila]